MLSTINKLVKLHKTAESLFNSNLPIDTETCQKIISDFDEVSQELKTSEYYTPEMGALLDGVGTLLDKHRAS